MTQAPPFKLAPVGGKFDVARIMPWVARNYGVSQTRQLAEMARLAIPPYRMTPDEYVRYALFRPDLTMEDKRRFVSERAGVALNIRLSPPQARMRHTSGNGSLPGNQLTSLLATWSSRLGPYTNVSLGLRHSQFDSDINPYQESAVIGSIRMQF